MDYARLRDNALTGDVIMVEGRGLIGTMIRVFTGQQISHVALLLWLENSGLWVAEMKELYGYRLTPAAQWVADQPITAQLYYGKAPTLVSLNHHIVAKQALQARARRYSYLSLVTVWLAQIFRVHMPAALVCSTFVQQIWTACGIDFSQTADPGDFLRLCLFCQPITRTKKKPTYERSDDNA